jgi:hypothetical protein
MGPKVPPDLRFLLVVILGAGCALQHVTTHVACSRPNVGVALGALNSLVTWIGGARQADAPDFHFVRVRDAALVV